MVAMNVNRRSTDVLIVPEKIFWMHTQNENKKTEREKNTELHLICVVFKKGERDGD